MQFLSFTSFFPQEKNKEILSRSVVEVQKEVGWALIFWGREGGPRIISPLLKGGSFLRNPNRIYHLS